MLNMASIVNYMTLILILSTGIYSNLVEDNLVKVDRGEIEAISSCKLENSNCNHESAEWKPYRPVLVIHGVMSGNKTLRYFEKRIQMAHPGTKIVIPNNYSNWASLEPMWKQVIHFGDLLMQMSEEYPDGINLIGYSQGGLIARSILEQYPNHNVKTFISLSSPQGGQYGTKFLQLIFPELVRETAYELFYSSVGQQISVGNYWNDPHHQDLFYNYCEFLPFVNNLNTTVNSNQFKQGILRLEKMVLIGGPNDSVITPWQSSQFGHFDKDENVVELRDTQVYTALGLRELDKAGKLEVIKVEEVDHFEWHENKDVIDNFVIPYLL